MNYKICTKCNLKLEATTDNFVKAKNGLYGLSARCKLCEKKWRDSRKNLKKEYDKNYVQENLVHIKERSKKYYHENIEEIKEKNKAYSAKIENKIHRQKYRATRKERDKELYELWRDNNRDRIRQIKKRRYQSQRSLTSNFTIEEWNICLQYFSNECSYCGNFAKELTQDHFIPVTKNGDYTAENIVPACRSCNSSKCNTDFEEWYGWQSFYSKEREDKILSYLGYVDI